MTFRTDYFVVILLAMTLKTVLLLEYALRLAAGLLIISLSVLQFYLLAKTNCGLSIKPIKLVFFVEYHLYSFCPKKMRIAYIKN